MRPRSRSAFRIAIICALKVEADAVLEVLDPESTSWGSFGKAEGDNNSYTTGSINCHNIVVLYSGAGIPKTSAAAGNLFLSFPNISLVLVVGVCGGVPIAVDRRDIFLGDLVISSDAVHYTSKKQYPTGSARITRRDDELGKQQPEARNFVRKFELSTYQKKLQQGIQTELEKYHAVAPQAFPPYPGISHDTLFAPDFQHKHRDIGACENGVCSTDGVSVCLSARTATCSELDCASDTGACIRRRQSVSGGIPALSVHVGTFGTGDTVMKSGTDRDLIASKDSIDAFEMESAGVWDQRPTIVLKSVCDYADSHKNDDWHGYAAGVAALGLKVLLQYKELPGVGKEHRSSCLRHTFSLLLDHPIESSDVLCKSSSRHR
ncbi:purine and uridine phosphorylase [Sarocladium strictum]